MPAASCLNFAPVIGISLVIQMADPSNMRRVAAILCPLDRSRLGMRRVKNTIRVIFDDKPLDH